MGGKRGQVLIISVLGIVVILLTVSSVLFATSLSGLTLPKTEFKEIATQIYFGSKAAVAAGLAETSSQLNKKMENSLYQNYTTLEELSENNTGLKQMSDWQNKTMINYPSIGLSLTFTRSMFDCNWNDPLRRHGYSLAETNVSIKMVNFGFEGFRDNIEIAFNATIDELISTNGRETSFKIRFVREKGCPVEQMVRSLISVLFEVYDRTNEYRSYNETEVKSVRYLGNGTYIVCYHSDAKNITSNLSLLRDEVSTIDPANISSSKMTVSDATVTEGWHLVTVVRDGNYLRLYIDGEEADIPTDIMGYGSLDQSFPLRAAVQYSDGDLRHFFDGIIDEIRILQTSRTDAWVNATYQNHQNEGFMTVEAEETLNPKWAGSWSYKRGITIHSDHVEADLANFPLLLVLDPSPPQSFNYDQTKSAGEDIRFTDDDNASLSYEIEKWDTLGKSFIWIEVPSISSSEDTTLNIYYGNPDASDDQNPAAVWDDYSLVEHLEEATGAHHGSSPYSHTGTYHGTHQNANGKIDGGDDCNGASEYVEWPNHENLNPGSGNFTVSLWADLHPSGSTETLLMKGDGSSTGIRYELYLDDERRLVFEIDDNMTQANILNIIDEVEAKYDAGDRNGAWLQLLYDLRPKLDPKSEESVVRNGTDTSVILKLIDTILSQLKPHVRVVARDFRGITVSVYGELDTPGEDVWGPTITKAQAQPDQCETGGTIHLTATADDRWYGNSNITVVEYFISESQPEIGQYGSGSTMSPTDGTFDESREDAETTLQSDDLSAGVNNIWIHGQDSEGN